MIRAVLWDIDGTLLDSEPFHFEAMVAVCARHGHTLAQAEYDLLLGLSMPEVFARITAVQPLPLSLPQFMDGCNDHYVAHVHRVPARPGARERIEFVARQGIPQACVSNSGRRVVDANMKALALPHALHFGISRDDVTHGKPHPEPYRRAAERLGVPPETCLVIEDSPVGARAARAAGMVTVAWPQQAHLEFDTVDYHIADLADLDWAGLCPPMPPHL
jgi:beta-phosphoglucomutase-like phosphatase (HAD superfamily)